MIRVSVKGDWKKTMSFLQSAKKLSFDDILNKYGNEGVRALSEATPVDTGKTASSWSYEIEKTRGGATITWTNSNVVNHVNIALILQYGHGTRNGGYVVGRDYINPAIQPVFDKMVEDAWREVTTL